MNFNNWTFTIVGGKPGFLMNNPASMQEEGSRYGASGGGKPTRVNKDYGTPLEDAQRRLYVSEGKLYSPAIWARQAIIEAGKGFKMSKNAARVILAAGLGIDEDKLWVRRNGKILGAKDWVVDSRRAVLKNKGQEVGIIRNRPLIVAPWEVQGSIPFDPELLKKEILEHFMKLAGQIGGWGDFSARSGGWFGRFHLEKSEVKTG